MSLRLPDAGEIARVVRSEFGVPVESMLPVIGGWDENALVWEATDAGGERWSVKASRRDITFGLAVARSLADAGSDGVVAPVRAGDGRPWATIDGAIVAVTPWVDGIDASDLGAGRVDWEAFGRTLRAVHEHPTPPADRPERRGIRRTDQSLTALIQGLDDRLAVEESVAPGGDEIRERWTTSRDRALTLARAERRLKRTRRPTDRVTLHGDPHLGNVVLDGSGSPWLIDFDESTVAPREVDLMLVELGVLFSVPIDEEQRRAFRTGYGVDTPVDEERIVRFGCVRAVEDLVRTIHRALDDPSSTEDYADVLDGMLGPLGQLALVEHALERLTAADAAAPTDSRPHRNPAPHHSKDSP